MGVRIGKPRPQKGRGFLFCRVPVSTTRQENCPKPISVNRGGLVRSGIQNRPGRPATKPPLLWSMGSRPEPFSFQYPRPLCRICTRKWLREAYRRRENVQST